VQARAHKHLYPRTPFNPTLNLQFNSTQCLALACARFSRLCARRRAREILGQATHTVKFAPHLSVVCVERVRVAVHLEASFDMLRLQVFR